MEELSFAEYLRKEIGLNDYQISKMQELLASFELKADTRAATEEVKVCPKCGADHPKVVRSGFAGSGKQMFRWASCGRRFTYDSGRLTWYSHQNADDHGKLYDSVKDLPGVTNAIADNGYNQKEDLADCLEGGIIPNVFPNTKKVDGAKVAGSTIDVSFVYEENGITEEEKASSVPDVIRKCLRAGVVPEVYKDQLELKPEGERFEIEREYEDATGDEYVDDLSDEEKIALAATGYFVRDLKADKVYCPRGVILRRKSVKKDGSVRYCNKLRCGKCSCQCFKESRTTRWKEVDFKNGQRLKPSSGSSPSTRRKVKSETKKVVFTFYPDQGKLDRRKCLSEHPFGTIKRYQNGDHFLLRTLDKIKGEVALMFLGYNIKRLCSLVSPTRVMAMLDA